MTVMIGVDPHKRSHTAVVIDHDEMPLATLRSAPAASQLDELLAWSASFRIGCGRSSRRTGSAIC